MLLLRSRASTHSRHGSASWWPHVGLALALLFGVPQVTEAQSDRDSAARAHFESGRLYYQEGDFERALQAFETAYALSPRPMMLLNLASSNERLGRPSVAAEHLRAYLASVSDAEERTLIERRIANLERLAGEMRSADEARAAELRAEVEADADASDEASPETDAPRRHRALGAPLAAFGVAFAGVATAVVTGPMAVRGENDLEHGCARTSTCTEASVNRIDRLALVADIGLGIAAVGAVVGTVLLIVDHGDEDEPTARVFPVAGPTTAGIAAEFRFR